MSFMIVFAMPVLMVASVELALDRTINTHFFRTEMGGDPLLWQHLFWFFGHPEVYIILVPALGIVASVLLPSPAAYCRVCAADPVFRGDRLLQLWPVGPPYVCLGLPPLGLSFFTVASFTIAIPSGIQIFPRSQPCGTGGGAGDANALHPGVYLHFCARGHLRRDDRLCAL
jgi:cytochrome c oxidase subunit I+III